MQTVLTGLTGLAGVVTGAGTGVGAAVAEDLAGAGMRLVLVGRRADVIRDQTKRLVDAGAEAVAFPADVRDYAQMERAASACMDRFGRLDVLVANAAIVDHDPIPSADPGLWSDVITTNVLGVLYGVRAAVPHMVERGAGHIVIVASGSGRKTYVGEPVYVASKHATVAFADCLRMEVAEYGIRVSVIEPGLVETPLIHTHPFALTHNQGVIPLQPVDCARAVRYVLEQPPHVNVFEVALYPTTQTGVPQAPPASPSDDVGRRSA
jgi:NADP-dependent 3-hydroxy acid dehydrogenase YdfG